MIEVDRPNRQARRRHGKSDSLDAVEAARAALSGRARGVAKTADGNVEAIRVLLVAFRSGREARTKCLNQLRHLGFCGPDDLRERFRGVTVDTLAQAAAALRPNSAGDPVMYATKLAMQTLGRRVLDIDADCARLHGELAGLVKATAPSLLTLPGVGTHTAALLLVAHRSGRDARIKCLNQLRHLGFCAPDDLRERFRGVTVDNLTRIAAGLRPNPDGDVVVYATKLALHTLGRRVVDIDADCARLYSELTGLVKATAPSLLALHGVELTRSDGHLPCGPCARNGVFMSTSNRRPRRKFTAEFKAEAVAMVDASGGQIAKVARELNIHESSLGNWVTQAREQAAGAPTPAERAEVRELRAELERVTRERDILGKAVAYFSASHPRSV